MNKVPKRWQEKAKKFAKYIKDDYNQDRHIIATVGSYGYIFAEDIKMLHQSLIFIGEFDIAERIKKV